jgi:hypothetical protein
VLENSMPMLWEVHEDAVRAIQWMITYDAGVQGHGIVREIIQNLNTKQIALQRHEYAHLDVVVGVSHCFPESTAQGIHHWQGSLYETSGMY